MRSLFIAVIAVAALHGCASPPTSTYEIQGVIGRMNAAQAEQAELEIAARRKYQFRDAPADKPLKLLRAPQPIMPAEDIAKSVEGTVTASIRFGENGEPEAVTVQRSTSESLSRAVVSALRQWRIEPLTRDQKPMKPTITQTFNFKTAP